MKKKQFFALVASISFVFVSCNKDEDIVIIDPEGPEQPTPLELEYKVIDYIPGPGQYINEPVSGFDNISTLEQAVEQAENRLKENLYVSLGSWGGYIVVKFDESIQNHSGYDFSIASNSFDTSNEPGIVWVMQDTNKNGLADDTWYELKGSDFGKEGYERNYWVRYSRPGAEQGTPWIDSNGETGVVAWLGSYHNHPFYYPSWVSEDSYTLYGSRLTDRVYQNPVTNIWTNLPFDWGYADNFGEDFFTDGNKNKFDIDNAVTEENLPANLTYIDFIKVQTAVNASASILGENSTEVTGFYTE